MDDSTGELRDMAKMWGEYRGDWSDGWLGIVSMVGRARWLAAVLLVAGGAGGITACEGDGPPDPSRGIEELVARVELRMLMTIDYGIDKAIEMKTRGGVFELDDLDEEVVTLDGSLAEIEQLIVSRMEAIEAAKDELDNPSEHWGIGTIIIMEDCVPSLYLRDNFATDGFMLDLVEKRDGWLPKP